MSDRRGHPHHVVFAQPEQLRHCEGGVHHGVVTVHHPFRLRFRARGEDQRGNLIARRDACGRGGHMEPLVASEFVIGTHAVRNRIAHDNDVLEFHQRRAHSGVHRRKVKTTVTRRYHHHRAAREIQDVAELVGAVVGQQRIGDRAEQRRGQMQADELGAIGQLDRNHVPGADPQPGQAAGNAFGLLGELRVGHATATGRDQRDFPGRAPHCLAQAVRQRAVGPQARRAVARRDLGSRDGVEAHAEPYAPQPPAVPRCLTGSSPWR